MYNPITIMNHGLKEGRGRRKKKKEEERRRRRRRRRKKKKKKKKEEEGRMNYEKLFIINRWTGKR